MDTIQLQTLTRRYGARRGVERLTLIVPEGALFGFLGPNGAGKTTTIRVLLGFLRPTSGSATIFGRDCWRDSPRIKRDVGYVPGDLRLYPWMNAHNALRIFGAVRKRDLVKSGQDLLEEFDLDPRVKVRAMSRGMRQKLGLILALALRPKLLVLDEPTAGLDPLMQQVLQTRLRQLARDGHTIFFSSHTLSEVETLCDRVAIVRDGELVADESLEALHRRAGHQVTIRWKDAMSAASLTPPACLRSLVRDGDVWSAALNAPVEELIRWLAPLPVADLTVERPDLQTLFRRYYQRDSETP